MRESDVLEIYAALERAGVAVWIDGGWAVDAVLGRVTRPHSDLDIAVEAGSVAKMHQVLSGLGFGPAPRDDQTEWNFVLADSAGRCVDVHVVVLDARDGAHAPALAGIPYPAGSLTGEGLIAGVSVRCVRAEFQLQFKLSYPPRPVDRFDVAELCALLGRPTPASHQ